MKIVSKVGEFSMYIFRFFKGNPLDFLNLLQTLYGTIEHPLEYMHLEVLDI